MAKERFDKWIEDTMKLKLETFYTTANTVRPTLRTSLTSLTIETPMQMPSLLMPK